MQPDIGSPVFECMDFSPSTDLVSTLILFGVLQGLGFAAILIRHRLKPGNVEFGVLMAVLTVVELESFLNYSGYSVYCPFMINVSPPLILLIGPLSFMYLKRLHGKSLGVTARVMHCIPAAVYFIYSFLFFLQPEDFKVNAVLRSFHADVVTERVSPAFDMDPMNIQGVVVVEGLALHLLCYSLLCVLLLRNQSGKPAQIDSGWSALWTSGMLVGSTLFILTGGVVNGVVIYPQVLPAYVIDLFCMVLVYATTIFWISRMVVQRVTGDKYSKSGLSAEFQQLKLTELRSIMETQKPYKSPDFSLSQMAKLSNLSAHHASQVINSGTGMTFNEFVNLYRVEEARNILASPARSQVKVELLAYELGYKSKSAFFSSFKRHTYTTPARFRELVKD